MDNVTQIRKAFNDYFEEPGVELPPELAIGVVRALEDAGSGWDIVFRLDKEGDKLFLDFYASHRRTNSRHHRILESGEVESLETFWEFGFVVYKDDPEREKKEREEIYLKNRKVEEILRAKGFM